MHKRDLRKLIHGLESAARYAACYFPRAWPGGAMQVEEFILDSCRRLMSDDNSDAIVTGGIYVHQIENEFEIWVDPTPWMKAEDKANGRK